MAYRLFGTNRIPLMQRKFLNVALVLATASPFPAKGQSGNVVLGAGYSSPAPAVVAPGQVITLLVQGIGANLTQTVQAQQTPLPTSLAGITVRIQQTEPFPSPPSTAVPIFRVGPHLSTCFSAELPPCTVQLTEIMVQIPYEMIPNFPRFTQSANNVALVVSENNVDGSAFEVAPVFDRIHILTNCDYVQPGDVLLPFSSLCGPVVTHGDGGPIVTAANPAKSGEMLVMYAFGLGATVPAAKTGEAAPVPALTLARTLLIGFDFRKNAAPQRVEEATPDQPAMLFAGLTPGFAGLYQVNFRVPPVPAGLPKCDIPSGPAEMLAVRTNLTVSVSGLFSFDGAAICVALGS